MQEKPLRSFESDCQTYYNDGNSFVAGATTDLNTNVINVAVGTDELDGSNGFAVLGDTSDSAGDRVGNAGDVDVDGFDDFIIGGRGTYGSSGPYAEAWVINGASGGFAGTINISSDLDGTVGFELSGVGAGPRAVDVAGDINGDGFADILTGQRNNEDAILFYGSGSIGSGGTQSSATDGSSVFGFWAPLKIPDILCPSVVESV